MSLGGERLWTLDNNQVKDGVVGPLNLFGAGIFDTDAVLRPEFKPGSSRWRELQELMAGENYVGQVLSSGKKWN